MGNESGPVGRRNTELGEVVSRAGNKSIVVEVSRRVQHPFYKKYITRRKKFYAHDERNECQVGDRVRIAVARPLSRLKRWRLVEIVERPAAASAPQPRAEVQGVAEERSQ
ncbi:MAG: 30S ribosomal protein S17 [Acidobacteria bacterium]|nr:30S ribosomal protein S17 [Acidobacteriota bacterium]